MRQLAASIMLVAALAFAFHSGVVAASVSSGSAEVAQSAGHQHDHGLASHDHAGHGLLSEAADLSGHAAADQDGHHHDGKGHCKTNCCGAACTIAVLSTPAFNVSRVEVSSVLSGFFVAPLSGIDPNGLKRPPRTPSIA